MCQSFCLPVPVSNGLMYRVKSLYTSESQTTRGSSEPPAMNQTVWRLTSVVSVPLVLGCDVCILLFTRLQ